MGQETEYYSEGRIAVGKLWKKWRSRPQITDPRHPDFARGVLDEIVAKLGESDDIDKEIREFSEAAAEQVTSAQRTIFEIMQNADDLSAINLRLAVRKQQGGELIAVHDGKWVEAADIIAMTLAFLSLKRDDPSAKGRFGIGLKTLNQVGSRLTVHSPPYHFEISKGNLRRVEPRHPIRGLYKGSSAETLLSVSLDREYDTDDVSEWIEQLDPIHLTFLDSLTTISYLSAGGKSAVPLVEIQTSQVANVEIELRPGYKADASQVSISSGKRRWSRYSIFYPVPQAQKRAHKATGPLTKLSIAISESGEPGILSAGLPLDVDANLPISLDAQFDPDLARRGLQNRAWNKWLFERLSDFISGVALHRFRTDPKGAWQAVPLHGEAGDRTSWEHQQIEELIEVSQDRIRDRARIEVDGESVSLDEIAYPGVGLTKLLTEEDVRNLAPGHFPLPSACRDSKGRWRAVMNEIANGWHLEIEDALNLLDADKQTLNSRSIDWFIGITNKALGDGLENALYSRPLLVGSEGQTYAPRSGHQFVRQPSNGSIASELGLEIVLHPRYFDSNCPMLVSEWISKRCIGSDTETDERTLKALARRDRDNPIALNDQSLLSLRAVLAAQDDDKREALSKQIGRVILIDGFHFRKGKKIPARVRPSSAYLPTQIAKDTGGWAAAAKSAEGISWIDARYAKILRSEDSVELGAKKFLLLLGARAGPRLERRGEINQNVPLPSEIPAMQHDAIQALPRGTRPSHLRNDWISPDLDRVIADISKQKLDHIRRARAHALFETLMREWEHYLEDKSKTNGRYFYYSWKDSGKLPATWIANCASQPWLSSKSNRKVAPREIAIETAATKLTRGKNRSQFVNEISESEAEHPLVRALEIAGAPSTGEIIESIRELKKQRGDRATVSDVLPFYVSISAKIRGDRSRRVGEIEVERLRHVFEKEELLLTNFGWQCPSSAYRGRPIYGIRRGAVAESKTLDRLWDQLQIHGATVQTCIDVISEIAGEGQPPTAADKAIVVDCLRWLAGVANNLTAIEKRRLAKFPIWTSKGWNTDRPVFAFLDSSIDSSNVDDVPIWQPNCSVRSIQSLIEVIGVSTVRESDFLIDPSLEIERTDEALAQMFRKAVLMFKDELAKNGDQSFHLIDWDELLEIELVCAPKLATQVKLDGSTFSVPRNVHVDRNSALYFRGEDDLKEPDAGMRVLSAFSFQEIPELAGYAWNYAWAQSELGSIRSGLNLAGSGKEDSADKIAAMLEAGKSLEGSKFRPSAKGKNNKQGNRKSPPRPKPRELKSFDDAKITSVSVTTAAGESKRRKIPNRALISNPKKKNKGRDKGTRNASLKNYDEFEREQLGLEVLRQVLKSMDGADLEDFTAVRRIGADGIDDLERYFELKVFTGDAPDEVRFEASEFERATKEGGSYFLAVISGLEVGKKTEVRIFSDPVRTLTWRRIPRIRLGGIRSSANALMISIDSE